MTSKRNRASAVRVTALGAMALLLAGIFWSSSPIDGDDSPDVSAYIDWGAIKYVDGEMWISQVDTEFSFDPLWVTNNETNNFYDETQGVYNLKWAGGAEEYAIAPVILNSSSTCVRVEYDLRPVSMDIGSDLPIVLMEEDHDYLADGSIQFFFSRNATGYYVGIESHNQTGTYKGATDTSGFSIGTWYHAILQVDYNEQTIEARISKTGSSTVLYSLNITDIGVFTPLPRVGMTSVGIDGGYAVGYLDNFTACVSFEGTGIIDVKQHPKVYEQGDLVTVNGSLVYNVTGFHGLASASYARMSFASAWNDEDRLLIISGGNSENFPSSNPRNDTFIYNVTSGEWQEMKDAPFKRLWIAGVWEPVAKKMIVFGGSDSVHAQDIKKETWAYDPSTDDWEQLADGPGGRVNTILVYNPINANILMCGGWSGGSLYQDLHSYNYSTDTWTQLRNMPAPIAHHAAVWDSTNNQMLVFGGQNPTASDKKNTLYAYDPVDDTWSTLTSGSAPRMDAAAVWNPVSNTMLVYGGGAWSGSAFHVAYNPLWEYTPSNDTWTLIGNTSIPPRTEHCAHWDTEGEQMLVYGGCFADSDVSDSNSLPKYNDLWSYRTDVHRQAGVTLTLEVDNPDDSVHIIWTNETDASGWAGFKFRLSKDAPLGKYTCSMTSDLGDRNDFNFTVKHQSGQGKIRIKTMTLTGNYSANGYVNATVVLESTYPSDEPCLLVLQVMNPHDVPLPPALIEMTVPGEKETTVYLNVTLPDKASTGVYRLQVELLKGYPHDTGRIIEFRLDSFTV